MENPLSEKDLNLLNAYLDDELSAAERSELEQRLQVEPQLEATLDGLRATIGILRLSERLRVPRNFTLDPAIYAKPKRNWLIKLGLSPIMPLVTTGATLLAIFSLGGTLLVNTRGVSPQPQAAGVAMSEPIAETEMVAPSAFSADEAFAPSEPPEAEALAEAQEEGDGGARAGLADSDAGEDANALPADEAMIENASGAEAEEIAPATSGETLPQGTEEPTEPTSPNFLTGRNLQLGTAIFAIIAVLSGISMAVARRSNA